jgi:hypothetical protein
MIVPMPGARAEESSDQQGWDRRNSPRGSRVSSPYGEPRHNPVSRSSQPAAPGRQPRLRATSSRHQATATSRRPSRDTRQGHKRATRHRDRRRGTGSATRSWGGGRPRPDHRHRFGRQLAQRRTEDQLAPCGEYRYHGPAEPEPGTGQQFRDRSCRHHIRRDRHQQQRRHGEVHRHPGQGAPARRAGQQLRHRTGR